MRLQRTQAAFTRQVPCELHVPERPDGSLLVALHGMGHTAASFAPEALPVVPERTTLLVPEGPYPFEKRRRDAVPEQGSAWYVWTGDSAAFVASLESLEAWLLRVVDDHVATSAAVGITLDPRRVALLGYSQGGYLAGFVGVRNPSRFRALVVAAGRVKDEVLADAMPRASSLRVLDVHGDADAAVRPEPCRASAERLRAAGVPVEFRTYPCGHDVLRDPACRADVRDFLERALA